MREPQVRWHQWDIISVFFVWRQRTLWSSRNLQEDLGIGHERSIGRDELDFEFGLTARAIGHDELQIAYFVPFQLPSCSAKGATVRQRAPLWKACDNNAAIARHSIRTV
jgi:hypothetical protein